MKIDHRLSAALVLGLCILVTFVQSQGNPPNTNVGNNRIITDPGLGTDGGQPCYFPFVFNNRTYSMCIDISTPTPNRTWCATTYNYDIDLLFGLCPISATTAAPTTAAPTTAAPTTAGPTAPPDACPQFIFTETVGLQVFQGIPQPQVTTVAQCQLICENLAASNPNDCTRFGFDSVNANPARCWINPARNTIEDPNAPSTYSTWVRSDNPLFPNNCPGVTGPTTLPTGCIDTFDASPDMNGQGGARQPSLSTLADCRAGCLMETFNTCEGFDYDTNNNRCFFFTTNPTTLNSATGVDHYTRVDCTLVSPTGGVCVTTYTPTANRLSFGGMLQSAQTTRTDCENFCTAAAACVGYDWDGVQCYTHSDQNNFDTNTNPSATGVTQYAKSVTCPGSPTPTGGSPTPTGGVCVETFSRMVGAFAFGGTEQPSETTQAACEAFCRADATCLSYDFSTLNSQCFTHTDDDTTLEQTNRLQTGANGVDHYTKGQTCPGVCTPAQDTFNVTQNVNVNGATLRTQETTASACQTYCLSQTRENCRGFDFNTAINQCWIHTSTANFNSPSSNADVDFYRRVDCVGGVCTEDTFDTFADTNVNGATRDTNANTVALCTASCLGNTACTGFDFNSGNNECWIHTGDVGTANRNTGATGITLYVRVPCSTGVCPSGVAAFERFNNTNAPGATRDTTLNTLTACSDECFRMGETNCYGFDYNRVNNECWLHDAESNVAQANRRSNNDVDLFVRVPCENCRTFDIFERMNGPGATRAASSINTIAECQQECLRQAYEDCVGFDFNLNANECWIHNNENNVASSNRRNNPDTNQYVRICVPGSPTPSGTPGSPTPTGTGPPQGQCAYTEEGRQYFGATESTAIDTRAACEAECTGNAACVAYAFDTQNNANRCWQHTNSADLSGSSNARTNYFTYTKGTCQVGVCLYTMMANTQYFNAQPPQTSATTMAECQSVCDADTNCVAYAFYTTPNPDECWIHMQSSDLSGGSQTLQNYDTYVKDSCTDGGSPTPTICPTPYTEESNTQYFGATGNAATTETACRNVCDADSTCLAYAFNTNNAATRCWIHSSTNDFTSSVTTTGYNTFRRNADCQFGSPPPCNVAFSVEENRQYFGADRDTAANNNAQCEASCRANTACLGYGLNTNTNPDECWIHIDANDFAALGATLTGYDSYQKSTDCPSPTPSGGVCVVTYTEHVGSFSIGGTQMPTANTLAACQDFCTTNQACGAIDFNNQNQCFWHNNGDWENQLNTGGSGVIQYRKAPCPGSPTAFSPTPTACVDTFTSSTGRFASGGSRDTNVNTAAECDAACLALSRTDCVGYDYNSQENSCWIHNNAGVFNNLQVDASNVITNYERVACQPGSVCTDTFMMVDNQQGFGATRASGVSGEPNCRARCLSQVDCVGYDVVRVGGECWIFTTIASLDDTATNNAVDHFIRQDCASPTPSGSPTGSPETPCPNTFSVERNTLAFGGVRINTANTEPECRDSCVAVSTCVGYDFDNGVNQCFQHTNIDNNMPANKRPAQGIDHYERDPCPGAGSPPPCQDIFDIFENTNAYDGTFEGSASTADACRLACLALSSTECVAADFNAGDNSCFLHRNMANLQDINTNSPGVTHYRRMPNPACGSPSPSPGVTGSPQPCTVLNTFAPVRRNTADTRYPTGNLGNTLSGRSVTDCQTECIRRPACTSFMYYVPSSSCIFYDGLDAARNTRSLQSFDLYVREENCPTGECPPVTRRIAGQRSNGGVNVPLANTLPDCLQICVDDISCAGIDYAESNTLNLRCFTHTSATIGNSVASTVVVQYVIEQRGCPDDRTTPPVTPIPSLCSMRIQANQLQSGGEAIMDGAFPRQMSAAECQNACLQDAQCVSVDYNREFQACFVHLVNGTVVSAACCDHYTKFCPACFESFEWRQDQVPIASQGVLRNANSQTACARNCFSLPTCDAFTFGVNGQCRIHLSIGRLRDNQIRSSPLTDLYVRDRCEGPPPPTLPPPTGVPTVCIKTGYNRLDGVQLFSVPGANNVEIQNGVNSENNCVARCTSNLRCVALTFNPGDALRRCTLYTTRQYANFRPNNPSVGLVSLTANCQGVTQPPTLPPPTQPQPEDTCRVAASVLAGNVVQVQNQEIVMRNSRANQFNNIRPLGQMEYTDIGVGFGCGPAQYMVCFSTGARSNTMVRVQLTGDYDFDTSAGARSYLVAVQREDSRHRGLDTMDRCLVVRGDANAQFSLTLRDGVSFSDGVTFLTGLSVFSLTQWQSARSVSSTFMVGRRGTFTCAGPCDVQFQTLSTSLLNPFLVNSNDYDRLTDVYTCATTGPYLFSWTLGAPTGSDVETRLQRRGARGTSLWVLDRLSTNTNDIDTMSKTVIINCQSGETVNLLLQSGSMISNENVLTSFSGFLIEPASNRPRIAFAAYRTTDLIYTRGIIVYDRVEVNEGNGYNPSTGVFTAPRAGSYLIYVSSGIQPGRYINLFVKIGDGDSDDDAEFGATRLHTSHNGNDHLGRALIVNLAAGERLYVDSLSGSRLRAGQGATSFMGFLIYEA